MSDLVLNNRVPKHVAIIMDGNGRWAEKRSLPRMSGHLEGVERVRDIIESAVENNIAVLTIFAFSSENWLRPQKEVSFLMSLFLDKLDDNKLKLHEQNIQLRFIGDLSKLSAGLQRAIKTAESLMHNNDGLKFRIAVNYGGQWDIVQAAQKIATKVVEKTLSVAEIDNQVLEDNLATAGLSPVDLFIRTSGEKRVSNFLLWQISYAELYFLDILFPDFDKVAFEQSLVWYSQRERRFGKTSGQIKQC